MAQSELNYVYIAEPCTDSEREQTAPKAVLKPKIQSFSGSTDKSAYFQMRPQNASNSNQSNKKSQMLEAPEATADTQSGNDTAEDGSLKEAMPSSLILPPSDTQMSKAELDDKQKVKPKEQVTKVSKKKEKKPKSLKRKKTPPPNCGQFQKSWSTARYNVPQRKACGCSKRKCCCNNDEDE
ncbi:unnamed protein product [Bursaphelenchus okinawaensis]|uniref:Uncharacterized protein n=1 Tax=Bursaphelenchus okinawaensis TaxID=465554 RepID=A0A811L3I8_9BILA|nr:unnamed protein product [Bursaphelenchus okinawaensis]CAG9115405.1 unnamed protein product [Bursaphelenchus okinawaensis]